MPTILYVGRDVAVEHQFASSLLNQNKYVSIRNSQVALQYIKEFAPEVICLDEELLWDEGLSQNGILNGQGFYQIALEANKKVLFFFLTRSLRGQPVDFRKNNHTTFIYFRDQLSSSRLSFAMEICKRQIHRTILTRELVSFQTYPLSFWHSHGEKLEVVIKPNEKVTDELKERLLKEGRKHLYIERESYPIFLQHHQANSEHQFIIAKKMDEMRSSYKELLSNLIDDSGLGNSSRGVKLKKDADKIIQIMKEVISQFPDKMTALDELPYPKSTLLAHGLNMAIYSQILGHLGIVKRADDLALASMVHDLGLSKINFHILMKNKGQFSLNDWVDYQSHVKGSLEILQEKYFSCDDNMKKMVMSHHENFDGTGYPYGTTGEESIGEAAVLSILDSLDGIRTSKHCNESAEVQSSIKKLELMQEKTHLKKKFSPKFLEQILRLASANYFKKAG